MDDYGAGGRARSGREAAGPAARAAARRRPCRSASADHLGVHPQKQSGLYYIGFPVFLGQVTGEQTIQIADLAAEFGGDIRLARQQNFILTNVPEARVDEVIKRVAEIGFPLDVNGIRGASVGCTGQPLCNYAVAETKTEAARRSSCGWRSASVATSRASSSASTAVRTACAHHWVTDIGLQGTTARGDEAGHDKLEAYEIYLRGGLGEHAEIGRPLLRRVPTDEAAGVRRAAGGRVPGRARRRRDVPGVRQAQDR